MKINKDETKDKKLLLRGIFLRGEQDELYNIFKSYDWSYDDDLDVFEVYEVTDL